MQSTTGPAFWTWRGARIGLQPGPSKASMQRDPGSAVRPASIHCSALLVATDSLPKLGPPAHKLRRHTPFIKIVLPRAEAGPPRQLRQDVREVVQQSVRRHQQSEQACAHWRLDTPPAKVDPYVQLPWHSGLPTILNLPWHSAACEQVVQQDARCHGHIE